MPQTGVYDLLKMLEIALDEGYSVLKYTIVNKREIEDLIDRIYAALPQEVQEARVFLKRKEELQNEAQQKATRVVQDAQEEADRILSKSEQIKAVERERIRITNEVKDNCEKIKTIAEQDADSIRLQATGEALKIRESAEMYAEKIFNVMENNLLQLQQDVKNCQIYVEQLKADAVNRYQVSPNNPATSDRSWVDNEATKAL